MDPLDSLLEAVYTAAAGETAWAIALGLIATQFNAWLMHLLCIDKRSGHVLFSETGGRAVPAANLHYVHDYHRIDPRLPLVQPLPVGTWLHCHRHISEDVVATHAFYRDFLIPYGGRYTSVVKLYEDPERIVLFGAHRGRGSLPFDAPDLAMLDRLKLHLMAALEIYQKSTDIALQAAAGLRLLDGLDHPMLLLAGDLSVVHCNPAARQAMAAPGAVSVNGGRLTCSVSAETRRLEQALARLQLDGSSAMQQRQERGQILLCEGDTRLQPLLLQLVALRPNEVLGMFGAQSLALALPRFADRRPLLDPYLVAQAHGLTPAEARIAIELAKGLSAKKIAIDTGLGLATVRTHIQKLLGKFGVAKQAGVVRALLAPPRLGIADWANSLGLTR